MTLQIIHHMTLVVTAMTPVHHRRLHHRMTQVVHAADQIGNLILSWRLVAQLGEHGTRSVEVVESRDATYVGSNPT